jgi:hypothetical protein
MNTRAAVALVFLAAACTPDDPPKVPAKDAPAKTGATKKVEVGKNVFLEVLPDGRRRVIVPAAVSFREGPIELFLCRRHTKEHESVLSADIDARDLHKALLAAGAVAGSPVKFEPKYEPAKGSVVKVSVRTIAGGKATVTDAREWVRDAKTRKPLAIDWVFGGSFFFEPPDRDGEKDKEKRQLYAANGGDVVCVSNFGTAMLDLPVASSPENEELMFEANTERIPELGSKVEVVFEPQPEKKDAKGEKRATPGK